MNSLFRNKLLSAVFLVLVTFVAFEILWFLRSWNLWNGDGEFCCKVTIGKNPFAITMSRCPLSLLTYRFLFQTLRPGTNWWVEDIVALSSCAAGVVYFWATVLLVRRIFFANVDRVLYGAFCSSSMILQVFCGHVEFYAWTCALLMVFALLGSYRLASRVSSFWPSTVLTIAAAFHGSGVFYFPAILALEYFRETRESGNRARALFHALLCFGVFVCAGPFHRYKIQYAAFLIVCVILWYLWGVAPERLRAWRQSFKPWLLVLCPWLVYFSIRTALGFYAEPLLHHVAPKGEPYDHGTYLYTFWSWEHLYDKSLFQWLLTPFAVPVGLLMMFVAGRRWRRNGWLFFLAVFAISAVTWEILFYPQLRQRDWDLYASTAVPLNLLVGYGVLLLWNRGRLYLSMMIVAHLLISVPIILDNADLLVGRGYARAAFQSEPVPAEVYLRGLRVGETPLVMENIRSGRARILLIPTERGYQAIQRRHIFRDGEHLIVKELLQPKRRRPLSSELVQRRW